MREILFRAKRLYGGEWIEGLLWKKKCNSNKLFLSCFSNEDDDDEFFVVDPETVGQFTGLTDKNGVKIFEGDIVKATILENSGFGTKRYTKDYIIKYHEKYCYFYLARERNNLLFDGNWSYGVKNVEVIGNIFDNPELLKGGGTDD